MRRQPESKPEMATARDVRDWIGAHVEPVGAIETAHERPWATVLRVPVQAFEPHHRQLVELVLSQLCRPPRNQLDKPARKGRN